jgi:hypothetical protein
MSEPAKPVSVYQLKIVLRAVSPLVWRRVLVRSDTTIAQFHQVIQTVMGREDEHLHSFRIHAKDHGIARLGRMLFAADPHAVTLADFRLRPRERFVYTCDFGDWWQHDVRLEQVLAVEPARLSGLYRRAARRPAGGLRRPVRLLAAGTGGSGWGNSVMLGLLWLPTIDRTNHQRQYARVL